MSCISFAHRPIARIGEFAAAVARLDVEDTPKVGIDRLQAPEAAAGQSGEFETSLGLVQQGLCNRHRISSTSHTGIRPVPIRRTFRPATKVATPAQARLY